MIDKQFKKEAFKESVKENVKFLYRKKLEEATQEQIFQAVCYTVKDVIIDNWLETQNAYKEQDPKTVYYMSMEFLMGRALGNNLINLTAYKEVKEALDELGLDLNDQQIHELAFKCSFEDTRTIGVFKQLNMKDMEKIYSMAR